MEAGGLQRSATSFRRQGSSGLVWDDKFLIEDSITKVKPPNININNDEQDNKGKEDFREAKAKAGLSRSQSAGGRVYNRTVRVSSSVPTNVDPPSPKLSVCGICGVFGKPASAHQSKSQRKR